MTHGSATTAGPLWRGPAVLLGFMVGLAAARPAQEPLRFRTETRMVLAPVSVKDATGKPVTGLPASAFTVLDEGVARPLVFFDERDEPLSTVLVLDVSSSMRGERLSEAKRAARTFVERIAGKGEIALVVFDDRVRVAVPWSDDDGRVAAVIDSVEASGGTALYDAIETALDLIGDARNRRRSVVVLSDGKDEDSRGSFGVVRGRVEGSEASLFTIGFYTDEEKRLFSPDRRYFKEPAFEVNLNPAWVLGELAGATGGLALFPSTGQELASIFESIAGELRHQYLLGFEPAEESRDGPGFRSIDILISSPEHEGPFRVRGRRGYAPQRGQVSEERERSVADAEFEVLTR
jgi:Ca-activated chloride channel family protein